MNTETFQLNFQSVAVIAIILSVISLIFVGVALIGPFEGQCEELKKKRLFTVGLYALLLLVIITVVAFYFGTCVTYGWMENVWNAISAVASWCSVGVSGIAVWAAVQIPKRIAEQNNKIALVNSRLEILDKIEDISSGISTIHHLGTRTNNSLSRDVLLGFLSFASLDEFNKNQGVINRYRIYFSRFYGTVREFSLLYANIMLNCDTLKKEEKTDTVLDELWKSINEANTFIHSEEFQQLDDYMNDTVRLDK